MVTNMIRFPCRCGHNFEEPDDAAGGTVQCPRCMLLNDVPTLGDLRGIAGDGTYIVDQSAAPPASTSTDDLLFVFGKAKVDSAGNAIDLRNPTDEISDI